MSFGSDLDNTLETDLCNKTTRKAVMLDFDFSPLHVRRLVFPRTSRTFGDIQSHSKSIKELVLANNL